MDGINIDIKIDFGAEIEPELRARFLERLREMFELAGGTVSPPAVDEFESSGDGLLERLFSELSSLRIRAQNGDLNAAHLKAIDRILGLDEGRYAPSTGDRLAALRRVMRMADSYRKTSEHAEEGYCPPHIEEALSESPKSPEHG